MLEQIDNIIYFNDIMYFVWLIFGFAILIKGADLLVDSAAKLAELFGVSAFIIGLSVVAFGTSTPEAAVGIFSAIDKANALSLGNVVGSDIANIALIIGLTSSIMALYVGKDIVKKEIPMSFGIQILLLLLIVFDGKLSRIDGIILLFFFILFIIYIAKNSKSKNNDNNIMMEIDETIHTIADNTVKRPKPKDIVKLITFLIIGLFGLIIGGELVVNNATSIAKMFNVNDTIIGLTIVSIGTTLPEMVATLTATFRKQSDIAVGNIIGSNIFNILFVLSLSAIVNPITNINLFNSSTAIIYDFIIMLSVTAMLFAITAKYKKVPKQLGLIFILIYISYIIFKIYVSIGI